MRLRALFSCHGAKKRSVKSKIEKRLDHDELVVQRQKSGRSESNRTRLSSTSNQEAPWQHNYQFVRTIALPHLPRLYDFAVDLDAELLLVAGLGVELFNWNGDVIDTWELLDSKGREISPICLDLCQNKVYVTAANLQESAIFVYSLSKAQLLRSRSFSRLQNKTPPSTKSHSVSAVLPGNQNDEDKEEEEQEAPNVFSIRAIHTGDFVVSNPRDRTLDLYSEALILQRQIDVSQVGCPYYIAVELQETTEQATSLSSYVDVVKKELRLSASSRSDMLSNKRNSNMSDSVEPDELSTRVSNHKAIDLSTTSTATSIASPSIRRIISDGSSQIISANSDDKSTQLFSWNNLTTNAHVKTHKQTQIIVSFPENGRLVSYRWFTPNEAQMYTYSYFRNEPNANCVRWQPCGLQITTNGSITVCDPHESCVLLIEKDGGVKPCPLTVPLNYPIKAIFCNSGRLTILEMLKVQHDNDDVEKELVPCLTLYSRFKTTSISLTDETKSYN